MKNLKIRSKLLILVTFFIVALLGVGISAMANMAQINDSSTIIAQNWMPSIIASKNMDTLISDFRVLELKHVISQNASEMSECETQMQSVKQEFETNMNNYIENLISTTEDEQYIHDLQTKWQNYLQMHDQMIGYSTRNNTAVAMSAMNGESQTLFDDMTSEFQTLVEFNQSGGDAASTAGDRLYSTVSIVMIAVLILVVVAVIGFALLIMRSILKPVNEIDEVARLIADGDLNQEITYKSKDELGVLAGNFNTTVSRLREYVDYIEEISFVLNEVADGNLVFTLKYKYAGEFAKVKTALNHIADSLNDTLGQINQSSDQVASGSDQVSSGAQALSQGATEQASSVEELAATMNEMSNAIQGNAEHANLANDQAKKVESEAVESNRRMQDMLGAMNDISESSKKIGKIIKDIEDIAFQTNILALNAAVEAARAGAAGKGFAVVADEVRNLANKSQEASQNTAALIESSLSAVQNGTSIADNTATSLDAVVGGIRDVAQTIGRIADASNEQAVSAAQVTQGIDQISAVVQTNSATAEESAAASEELSGQAQVLKGLVGRFKLRTTGGLTAAPEVMRIAAVNSAPVYDSGSSAQMDYSSKY